MENRFGVKDFVMLGLLVAVIVMVWLCMTQYDRQWDVLNQANNQLRDLTRDVSSVRRMLEKGGVPAGSSKTSDDANAGFERISKTHSNPDYAPGDVIVETMTAVPSRLTPLISLDSSSHQIENYVLETLCNRDPDTLKLIPGLAKNWRISDDQLSIDFELRRGITFSDGEPLTADDVVFTMDLERNEEIQAPRVRTYLDKLDRVEKTGDYAVRFIFKEPYFKSLDVVAAQTSILSRKFYSQFTPKEFNESTGFLFGSGPYRLADPKSWRPEPGKPVELIRNERYWGVAPAADRIIWKMIANSSARATAFRNGETDVYGPTPEQYDSMCKDPELVSRTQHFEIAAPTANFSYIGWNESLDGKPTFFADKRVRQAMTMLIDRQAIVKDIMHGHAIVNSSSFNAMTPQADPSIQPLPYDPVRAEQLLADAGFIRQNGVLNAPDGQQFNFKLSYNSAYPVAVQTASFVKDSLARAGIIVNPTPLEWAVLLQRMKDKKLQAYISGMGGDLEEDPHQIFCTDAIAGMGDNSVSYSNLELDRLVAQARSTMKDEDRMPIWHKVHRIIAEDQPFTFLYTLKNLGFVDGRFKGVEATKLGLNSRTEWYVPTANQKYKN